MGINYEKGKDFKFKTPNNSNNRPTGTNAKGRIPIIMGMADVYTTKELAHRTNVAKKDEAALVIGGFKHQSVHGIFIGNFRKEDGATEEKILLSKRGLNKTQWPGYWDITVGEHIMESNISPLDTLKNAVRVELGITLDENQIAYMYTVRDVLRYNNGSIERTDDEFRHVFVIRTGKLNNDNVIIPKDKDTIEYKWFSKKEFDELLKNKDSKIIRYKYFKGSEKYSNFSDLFSAKELEIGDELEKYLIKPKRDKTVDDEAR